MEIQGENCEKIKILVIIEKDFLMYSDWGVMVSWMLLFSGFLRMQREELLWYLIV